MQIKKRTLPMYIFLNVITLGIYGFIVCSEINEEIEAICKGDGEKPRLKYSGALLIRSIPIALGLIFGLVAGIIAGSVAAVFLFMAIGLLAFSYTFGSAVSGIYYNYWWYQQANRLKLNAHRYGLEIKESGTDHFLFRTAIGLLFIPVTVAAFVSALLVPSFIVWLISLAGATDVVVTFICIIIFIVAFCLSVFGVELSAGANFSMYFMFKNLNRFADAARNGGRHFDSMNYEYYPSLENQFPKFLPGVINGMPAFVDNGDTHYGAGGSDSNPIPQIDPPAPAGGCIIGLGGSCQGYKFEFDAGEELIIGKDAKLSSIVIDPAYKEVSRKHVGVRLDVVSGKYIVTDYSSNGTFVNGNRLESNKQTYLPRGTELKLANGKNSFRLD